MPAFDHLLPQRLGIEEEYFITDLHSRQMLAEVPPGIDRIRVMNEVLPWLPLLLALSASSPFWEGRDSGYFSYRQAACDEWPRMGVPEYLEDKQAYGDYLALMRRVGALHADTPVWWGIRPSRRYPTLELRLTDACPHVEDALTLAGLFSVMVRHACLQPEPGQRYTPVHRWLYQENRVQARRRGPHGRYTLGPDQPLMDLRQWLTLAQRNFEGTAQALGLESVFEEAFCLLRTGTSTERQLHCFHSQPAHLDGPARCRAVVDLLLAQSRTSNPPHQEIHHANPVSLDRRPGHPFAT